MLLAGLELGTAPAHAGAAFLLVGERHEAFAGLSYELIGSRGALINEPARIGAGRGV